MSKGSSYDSAYVLCPFYIKSEGIVLVCEGFPESASHRQIYTNKKDCQKQLRLFCQSWNYKNCECYRLIMESKYHDEVNESGHRKRMHKLYEGE